MFRIINNKIRTVWLLMIIFGISLPIISTWATGFTPVVQCFRNAGAPNWNMQLYSSGVANTKIPLTAASGVDVAGSGWLRLTDNNSAGNESGTAYYNLPINISQLGIQASFSYTAWGGNGADGISLFLFDGATPPTSFVQGVFGGGLGYCQQGPNSGSGTVNGYSLLPGLSNAVVGVGIDDYGNFANNNDRCPNYGRNGRTNMGSSNSYGTIAVRGQGNSQSGYSWLADTNNTTTPSITPTWYTASTSTRPTSSQFYRNVLVNISPTVNNATTGTSTSTSYNITTSWQTTPGGAYTQLLSVPYPAGSTSPPGTLHDSAFPTTTNPLSSTLNDAWTPLPPTVKFGFAGSTGGSYNYHEIEDTYFTEGLPDIAITQNIASASGGLGSFEITVTNLGSSVATNATLTATFSGLSNIVWSCVPSVGSNCPATNGTGAPANVQFSLGIVGNVTFIVQGTAASGTTISDNVTIAGATGFNDADLTSNTSSPTSTPACTSCSLTVGSGTATQINLSQLPQTSNSATSNTVVSGQVQTNTQVYVSQYNSSNWWGDLLAYNLTTSGSGSTATLSGIASLANWSASCNLTGGTCPQVNGSSSTATVTAQTPSSRSILSWNGTTGIPFTWSNLSSTVTSPFSLSEQSALGTDPVISSGSLYKCSGNVSCTGTDVLNYLTGVRTNEQGGDSSPGPFRTRNGILGDIIDSTPVFVGTPDANYPTTTSWSDLLYSSSTMPENTTTNSYATYQTNQATRENVVYVASNDGMVHGFDAGNYTINNVVTSSSTTASNQATDSPADSNTSTTTNGITTQVVVTHTTNGGTTATTANFQSTDSPVDSTTTSGSTTTVITHTTNGCATCSSPNLISSTTATNQLTDSPADSDTTAVSGGVTTETVITHTTSSGKYNITTKKYTVTYNITTTVTTPVTYNITTTTTVTTPTPSYQSTTNTGTELLAYIPETVLLEIAQGTTSAFLTNYNFTDPAYSHHFFVNPSPATGDLYYNKNWHTWLVGGLGGGGQAIYALDITSPTTNSSIPYASNFAQSTLSSNASSLVINELNMSNLTCSGNTSCKNDLGWTYGTPIIARMHNGTWAVIFGNGYNSTNGTAAIFIATINSTCTTTNCTSLPSWTIYDLQTNSQTPNGISYVTPADLDGDHVVDYLYAGDLFGNVWRFDVTSNTPANWATSTFGATGSSASPLFTATNAGGVAQPITTAVQIEQTSVTTGLNPRLIIMFGTGKNLDAADLIPNNTANGVQSIYGIWDWNMTAWNSLPGSADLAVLTAPQTITRSNLLQQTVTGTCDGTLSTATTCVPFTSSSTSGYRTLSGNTVCWVGTAACVLYNQYGFYLDLPSPGEEVIYNSLLVSGLFIVNTTIPSAQSQGLTCSLPSPPGGWTMAINPLNGGVLLTGSSIFANSSGNFGNINNSPVSGMYVNAVGTPSVLSYNNSNYIVNKTASNGVIISEIQPNTASGSGSGAGQRLNWIQLR